MNKVYLDSKNELLKVSVIIPTYNGSNTILRAVHSVLNHTYSNFELIVVDDCSKDNTFEVVKSIEDERVKVLRHRNNKGGSAARNTGIKEAKGEYIAFLDDDDEWLSEKVEKQVKYLRSKDSSLYKGVVCSYMILSGKKWRTVIQTKEG
ncbi:MAG TPA: glycosyltransferase family 2 protein, partial [Candidatus Pacearchaeota archaeon]|nr:glycosyltransferase family 2 protein [Candidatus Pacearchaeota archaeon]